MDGYQFSNLKKTNKQTKAKMKVSFGRKRGKFVRQSLIRLRLAQSQANRETPRQKYQIKDGENSKRHKLDKIQEFD